MKSFVKIVVNETSKGIDVSPAFLTTGKDIMKRGGKFYAVVDETTGMWTKDESVVYDLVDHKILNYISENYTELPNGKFVNDDGKYVTPQLIRNSRSGQLKAYKAWIGNLATNFNYKPFDEEITFKSDVVTPEMYRSKRLDYDMGPGDISAYDELMSTLYSEDQREKIEWSIGSVLAGWEETKKNDRMVLLYGKPGSGKSTVLEIIQKIFQEYCSELEVDEVVNNNRQFAKAALKDNPLVVAQDDGSLKRIDNQEMNKILSHAKIEINEKGKEQYYIRSRAICFVATNEVVDLSDSRKGMNRRILDVYPSGNKISPRSRYYELVRSIDFELGAIAQHCLDVYNTLTSEHFSNYIPTVMQDKTNVIKNFFFDKLPELKENDPITRGTLYKWYNKYCEDEGYKYVVNASQFGEQIMAYGFYESFEKIKWANNKTLRNAFFGLKEDVILGTNDISNVNSDDEVDWLTFDYNKSIFDVVAKDFKAQYAREDTGNPRYYWDDVKTTLKDLNTSKLHWVQFPEGAESLIVLDFDLVNEQGEKDFNENLKAARNFPPTYAELSKSGGGIHLHYIYRGNCDDLAHEYSPGIEIKVYKGKQALRRMLTKCNMHKISELTSGLPLQERKKMIGTKVAKNEQHLRRKIEKALRKEVHPDTTSNVNYIMQVLEDAYNSDMHYDVSDMRGKIFNFAAKSSNQAPANMAKVDKMKFHSDNGIGDYVPANKDTIIFFDIEVFPNVLIVCWKTIGSDVVVKMFNPTASELEELVQYNLVGYNNLNYDNPIIYARMQGASIPELYQLSKAIVNNVKTPGYSMAKNLSYTDVYDFSSKKQSLKKFEIELGIAHVENAYDWDKDLPEHLWDEVAEYCANDVRATEAVFENRKADFIAREILAKIAGGTVNDSTNTLTTKLIFGDNRNPQSEFVYTDLSKEFPGYVFDPIKHESTFMGEVLGEGGYVYADPGAYWNVKTFDVASEHPHSIIALNLFGDKYTKRFADLVKARVMIKHKDLDGLSKLFNGAFMEFIDENDLSTLKPLSGALKIAINSVYGLTAAHFPNPFKDDRNIDNIVAKRGALFMCQLKNKVIAAGGHVIHCKTDSIKVVDPTPEIEQLIEEEGKKYGYTFEVEAEYNKICLINKAVYIADEKTEGWTATGDQFAEPIVFKTLFSGESIELDDLAQVKSVSGDAKIFINLGSDATDADEENMKFVGKVGSFVPVTKYGGSLVRVAPGKRSYVSGTKGYRWMLTEDLKLLGKDFEEVKDIVDYSYFDDMLNKAKDAVNKFVDYDYFVNSDGPRKEIPFESIGEELPFAL